MYFQFTQLLLANIVVAISAVLNSNQTITFKLIACTTNNRLTGNVSIGEFTFPIRMFSKYSNNEIKKLFWIVKGAYGDIFYHVCSLEKTEGIAPEVFFASLPPGEIHLDGSVVIYKKDNHPFDAFELTTWNYELDIDTVSADVVPDDKLEESQKLTDESEVTTPPAQVESRPSVESSWSPTSWLYGNTKGWDDEPESEVVNEQVPQVESQAKEVEIVTTEKLIRLNSSERADDDLDDSWLKSSPLKEMLLALKSGNSVRVPYVTDPSEKTRPFRMFRGKVPT